MLDETNYVIMDNGCSEEPIVTETQNNNNHSDYLENNKIEEDEVATCSNEVVSDGDAEVNSIIKDASEETEQTNDSANYSPFPPRKISRRSKDSLSRKSTSSPRMKTSTPNSFAGTPAGSSSEREPNSSPASIDNPPTNGSLNNDTFGDGERSDKSGDSHSISSSTFHSLSTTNGPSHNHLAPSIAKRSVTLQMLLAAGILKPGDGTMSLEYHGQKFVGDFLENGHIKSQETSTEFTSPSAWATACKQIINPDKQQKKSGCGWASIKYKGLKLDYYKTVWFKRLREGSIDIRNISNGTSATSDDSEDEDKPFCVLSFEEHYENNPIVQSAQQLGAKVMITCSHFHEIDRLQPFYIKISSEALALADFHCNITNTESLGYISGRWNSDQNSLKMETVHSCRVLMPNSTSLDCDTERNRIALEIQRIGHDVVGWYHSHPKAPPQPSKDDISRQLDYQIVMKGSSESSYIPCVGVIISPLCFSNHEELRTSPVQFFWVMPPPENRALDMGRPMHLDYETYSSPNLNLKKIILEMGSLIQFYKEKKDLVDINDLSNGKYEKLQESFSSFIPETRMNADFWDEVKQLFAAPPLPSACSSSTGSSNVSTSSVSSTALNSVYTPNSTVSNNATPPVISTTPTLMDDIIDEVEQCEQEEST